jgi:hypothetical protein
MTIGDRNVAALLLLLELLVLVFVLLRSLHRHQRLSDRPFVPDLRNPMSHFDRCLPLSDPPSAMGLQSAILVDALNGYTNLRLMVGPLVPCVMSIRIRALVSVRNSTHEAVLM